MFLFLFLFLHMLSLILHTEAFRVLPPTFITKLIPTPARDMVTPLVFFNPFFATRTLLAFCAIYKVSEKIISHSIFKTPFLVLLACGILVVFHFTIEAISLFTLRASEIVIPGLIKKQISTVRSRATTELICILFDKRGEGSLLVLVDGHIVKEEFKVWLWNLLFAVLGGTHNWKFLRINSSLKTFYETVPTKLMGTTQGMHKINVYLLKTEGALPGLEAEGKTEVGLLLVSVFGFFGVFGWGGG